jgi:hypothetical protein
LKNINKNQNAMRPNNLKRQEIEQIIEEFETKRHKLWMKVGMDADDRELLLYYNQIIQSRGEELKLIPLEPEPGMGATIGWNGDYYPYTIHKVSDDLKKVWASRDEYEVIKDDLYSESAPECRFWNNHKKESQWTLYKLRKNGRYVREGASMHSIWDTLQIGYKEARMNPSF